MSDELKPCRDAFKEWWDSDVAQKVSATTPIFKMCGIAYEAGAAWNRRSPEYLSALEGQAALDESNNAVITWRNKHTALLDAVRWVRDKLHRGGYAEHVSSRGIADTLTRIIDEDEKQSVTKQVGTGSTAKSVTVTPDE